MTINITPQLYADLRNSGYSNKDIASKIDMPISTLSRKVSLWFQQGFLLNYYNVYLDKLLYPVEVCVLTFNQRVSIETYLYQKHPLTVYYSPLPKPIYFIYRRMYSKPGEAIVDNILPTAMDREIYKVTLYSVIEKTIVPRERYANPGIELVLNEVSITNTEFNLDEYDQYLAELFFKYYNPPVSIGEFVSPIEYLRDLVKTSVYRNHYYRHLYNKLVKKRFIIRDLSRFDYCILLVYMDSYEKLFEIISNLYSRELIGGVDQINFTSIDPVMALIHCWINREKLWRHDINHEYFNNVKYDFYLVKQIM